MLQAAQIKNKTKTYFTKKIFSIKYILRTQFNLQLFILTSSFEGNGDGIIRF